METTAAYLRDRVGGGHGRRGSIGASRVATSPGQAARLILVDHAENNLFEIRGDLEDDQHFGSLPPCWPTARTPRGCSELFADERPSVVFHAAAYKHVGLMEENPVEAVRNNAVATRIVAAAAGEAGVERFVLVSPTRRWRPPP